MMVFFFINYVAMSAFCLRGKSFNENRNHHQCIIGIALILYRLRFFSWIGKLVENNDLNSTRCTGKSDWVEFLSDKLGWPDWFEFL